MTGAPAVYQPLSPAALRALLPADPGGLVLFDVDLTLGNGLAAPMAGFEVRPGATETIRALSAAGFRVGVWTAGGPRHAREVAARLGVLELLTYVGGKADFPPTTDAVQALVGEVPVLTVDDDWGEAVPGIPFYRVQAFWGSLADAATLAAYEETQRRDTSPSA